MQIEYIAFYGEAKVKSSKRMLPPPDIAADDEANRAARRVYRFVVILGDNSYEARIIIR